jgi:hypothetical protein
MGCRINLERITSTLLDLITNLIILTQHISLYQPHTPSGKEGSGSYCLVNEDTLVNLKSAVILSNRPQDIRSIMNSLISENLFHNTKLYF